MNEDLLRDLVAMDNKTIFLTSIKPNGDRKTTLTNWIPTDADLERNDEIKNPLCACGEIAVKDGECEKCHNESLYWREMERKHEEI